MTVCVNVLTDMAPQVLSRQEPASDLQYIYSNSPVAADWHVVLGLTTRLEIPNSTYRTIFTILEPPEIMQYDTAVLAMYGTVLSAPFRYLRRLSNLVPEAGLLPWRIGLGIEGDTVRVNLSLNDLATDFQPCDDVITVVTSEKTFTREQVQRLKLIDYLHRKLPELRVYGRGFSTVDDKAEVLTQGRFHLALENCKQEGFWTEKLSDPILAQNITFYSGANSWQHFFSPSGTIVEIDTARPSKSYEVIRKSIDSSQHNNLRPALRANKDRLLTTLNIHKAIERAIAARRGPDATGVGGVVFPAHRSRRERILGNLMK